MILSAERIAALPLPRPSSEAARRGLRFQAQVGRALGLTAAAIGARCEAEPWFAYDVGHGRQHVVPDFLFSFGDFQLVIEVKLTFVLDAPAKLAKLYVPVVGATYGLRPRPLVIARHLTPEAAPFRRVETLGEAIRDSDGEAPILHYLGRGPLLWTQQTPIVTNLKEPLP